VVKHWRPRRARRPGLVSLALAGLALALCAVSSPSASGQELPAPACTPGVLTPAQTAGPFYKSGAPERTSLLEPGVAGAKLMLSGYVLTGDCQPIPGAWLDFWQADGNGQYDNRGFGLRGHQYTDAAGRYTLETVLPAEYTGRTAHIHVKVQAPGGPELTSQLYFPNMRRNATDGIFNAALLVTMQESPDGYLGTFDFVVPGP
jgi:protocatechuate 3,4-dioxygenase beta subunit